jgi:uncharacterized protein (DUF2132 family)
MENTSKDLARQKIGCDSEMGYYKGYGELGKQINIKCFTGENPSVSSSLKFLRKTPWQGKSRKFVSLRFETKEKAIKE